MVFTTITQHIRLCYNTHVAEEETKFWGIFCESEFEPGKYKSTEPGLLVPSVIWSLWNLPSDYSYDQPLSKSRMLAFSEQLEYG
jgi:hypothetical protein